MIKFEEAYQDVLQNIEFGIVTIYRQHRDLSDYDVMRTLEALIDYYVAQKIGRSPRHFSLSSQEQLVFDSVQRMCEWRLGRVTLEIDGTTKEKIAIDKPKTIDEIIQCLKRILKSVTKWDKRRGKQGYLDFVSQYII